MKINRILLALINVITPDAQELKILCHDFWVFKIKRTPDIKSSTTRINVICFSFIYPLKRSSYFLWPWTNHLLSCFLTPTFFVIKNTIMLLWESMQLTEDKI